MRVVLTEQQIKRLKCDQSFKENYMFVDFSGATTPRGNGAKKAGTGNGSNNGRTNGSTLNRRKSN